MSTIVVVKKDGLAAIGADTLAKFGPVRESADYIANSSKIVKSRGNYLAFVGHASLGLVVSSYLAGLKSPPALNRPEAIFDFARGLHRSLKEDYFLRPEEQDEDEFESSRLDCLIANPAGIFGLYALRSVQEYTKFYSFGSGYAFAMGAMKAVYGLDLPAGEIARIGLEAAAEFDDGTGEPLEIHQIRLVG